MGPFAQTGVGGIWGEGFEDRPFKTGLFQKVIGVQWGGFGLLFIDSDGVFTSKDGKEWGNVSDGFSANAVAYGRKLWVAATDGGMQISEDKGKTWKPGGGPSCQQLVFAGPLPTDNPKEDEGYFYALNTVNIDGGSDVYSSSDGKSWGKVLSLPPLTDEDGVMGYVAENLGNQGSTVVLTGDEWTRVPPSDTEAGTYTRATRWDGSGGSIGGPVVYGPDGNAGLDNHQSSNVGGGATADLVTETDYVSYLIATGQGSGVVETSVVVNGATIATGVVTVGGGSTSGERVSGGIFMAASDSQGYCLTEELSFDGNDISMAIFITGLSGGSQKILGPFPLDSISSSFMGNMVALPSKRGRGPVFCTVAAVNGSGGLWINTEGGGWTNTFPTNGGAVGRGKIAAGNKS
jgi:hypothetical protein